MEYQEEFEILGNIVHEWSEEAFIEMFMDGLTMEIAELVRMFKPQPLKDAISLAPMNKVHKMGKSHRKGPKYPL